MILSKKRELIYVVVFLSLLLSVVLYFGGYGVSVTSSNQVEFKKYSTSIVNSGNTIKKWIVKPIYLDGTN